MIRSYNVSTQIDAKLKSDAHIKVVFFFFSGHFGCMLLQSFQQVGKHLKNVWKKIQQGYQQEAQFYDDFKPIRKSCQEVHPAK
jgi:hypothetical protein